MSGKSELDIFSTLPPQLVVDSAVFSDIYPSTGLESSSTTIEFVVQGSPNEYLDLNDTLLYLQLKFVKTDHTNLAN